jgi:hypothetical protein
VDLILAVLSECVIEIERKVPGLLERHFSKNITYKLKFLRHDVIA